MKFTLAFLVLCFSCASAIGQEYLAPLEINTELMGEKINSVTKSNHNLDSTFIYELDTLTLPVFDEFSRNKFQDYIEDFEGANTTSTLYYKLLDPITELPLGNEVLLTDSTTFRLEINLQNDTIIFHPFDPIEVLYHPLTNYPIEHELRDAYPPYIIIDSIADFPTTKDTIWLDQPIFFQDSARIFKTSLNDPNKIWINRQAYHNYRFAKKPWSLGVVTFDGLNERGFPYNFGSSINQTCDTLNSKVINMSNHAPSDSIYFSFLYQSEGYGDPVEDNDSLYLDFYDPVEKRWERVWRTAGTNSENFKVAHFRVIDPNYFEPGFKFRFMNYTTPAGMLDHFHIDYVHLRPFSGYQDTLFRDFAFVYPVSTLLKDYISVPWKHYKNSPSNKFSDRVAVTVRNNSELPENNQDGQFRILYDGETEHVFTLNATALSGGNINYAPRTTYTSFHDFSTGYTFDTSVSDSLADFEWIANASAQFPSYPQNDSTFGMQSFRNYYAYDDGSAEKAYGVFGSQAQIAHKFTMYEADELIAIRMHFVPTVNNISNNLFLLAVWEDKNGRPGKKIYEDEFFFPQQPRYGYGRNGFIDYFFKDTITIPVDKTFYIGWRQIDEDRLTLGFDMNHDNSDKIFWSVDGGGSWNNSNFKGSLMMRPVINSNLNHTLGVTEKKKETFNFKLYPNPTTTYFRVETDTPEPSKLVIYDLNGRFIKEAVSDENIDVQHLEKGLYLVTAIYNNQKIGTKKLVIQ